MKFSFKYTFIIAWVLTTLSCEVILGPTCTGEDEIPVNKVFVREFITDQNFDNITPLRSYPFGSDDELNGIGNFDYTLDGSLAVLGNTIMNYGADLTLFDKNAIYFSMEGLRDMSFVDYNNIDEKFLTIGYSSTTIKIPERNDSITVYPDLVYEFSNASQVDTIFSPSFEFINFNTYKSNDAQHVAYDKDGNILILTNDWITHIEKQNGNFSSTSEILGSHLIKVLSENKYDTLFTYIDTTTVSQYIQLRFSSTKAGTFIRIDNEVFILDNEKELQFVYSGSLPDRSNLSGNTVISDFGGEYYDLVEEKYTDLRTIFYDSEQVIYAYPSNNGSLALMLGGNYNSRNHEKIFLFDTHLEVIIDSLTLKDLSEFDIVDDSNPINGNYARLINPVFTSDNRMIFMYVFEENFYKCRE